MLRVATMHDGDDVVVEEFDQAVALLAGTVESMEKAGSVARLKLQVPPSRLWRRR